MHIGVICEEPCKFLVLPAAHLRKISRVASSSAAAAMGENFSDRFSMVPLISAVAPADQCAATWMPLICRPISSMRRHMDNLLKGR
jgi:hypothetical protein